MPSPIEANFILEYLIIRLSMSFWFPIDTFFFIEIDMVLIDNKYHSVNTSPTREINEIWTVFFPLFDAFKWIQVRMLIWTLCTFYLFMFSPASPFYGGSEQISFVKILSYLWYVTLNSLLFGSFLFFYSSSLNAPLFNETDFANEKKIR